MVGLSFEDRRPPIFVLHVVIIRHVRCLSPTLNLVWIFAYNYMRLFAFFKALQWQRGGKKSWRRFVTHEQHVAVDFLMNVSRVCHEFGVLSSFLQHWEESSLPSWIPIFAYCYLLVIFNIVNAHTSPKCWKRENRAQLNGKPHSYSNKKMSDQMAKRRNFVQLLSNCC